MEKNTQIFQARWSFVVWVVTIGVAIIFGMVFFTSVESSVQTTGSPASIEGLIILAIMASVFLLSFLFAPRRYVVTDTEIIIVRAGPNVVIPIGRIAEVQTVRKRDLGVMIRLLAVGGIGGMYGRYHSFAKGLLFVYATNMRTLVLMKLKNGQNVLISAEDSAEFVEAVVRRQIHPLQD